MHLNKTKALFLQFRFNASLLTCLVISMLNKHIEVRLKYRNRFRNDKPEPNSKENGAHLDFLKD